MTTDKSLYIMSKASQNTWSHRIEPDGSIGEDCIRYSLTFRSVGQSFKNSTVLLGDSNSKYLRFGSDKGTFGEKMPGKRVETYHIGDIDPSVCMGYRNVIILAGINDLTGTSKGRKSTDPAPDNIKAYFNRLTLKLEQIQALCPSSNIYLSPILPTKSMLFNNRAMKMNDRLLTYTTKINPRIRLLGFGDFVGRDGLLMREYGSFKNPGDPLHLGQTGIRKLAQIYIDVIFRPKVDGRSYSSALSGDYVSPPWT